MIFGEPSAEHFQILSLQLLPKQIERQRTHQYYKLVFVPGLVSKRHIYFYIFTVILYFSKHKNSVHNKKVKAAKLKAAGASALKRSREEGLSSSVTGSVCVYVGLLDHIGKEIYKFIFCYLNSQTLGFEKVIRMSSRAVQMLCGKYQSGIYQGSLVRRINDCAFHCNPAWASS